MFIQFYLVRSVRTEIAILHTDSHSVLFLSSVTTEIVILHSDGHSVLSCSVSELK